jgi:hypothetical protein
MFPQMLRILANEILKKLARRDDVLPVKTGVRNVRVDATSIYASSKGIEYTTSGLHE